MTETQISNIFDKVYDGQTNFMTPKIEKYKKRGNLLLEFSSGDFLGKKIYGATFLRITKDKYEKCPELNKCVDNLEEAIEILNNNYKEEQL